LFRLGGIEDERVMRSLVECRFEGDGMRSRPREPHRCRRFAIPRGGCSKVRLPHSDELGDELENRLTSTNAVLVGSATECKRARMPETKSKKTKSKISEVRYDAEVGRRAFESLTAARQELGREVKPMPRLDMKAVAVLAIGVAKTIATPEVRKRFATIESALPRRTVDALEPAAWALFYAAMQRATDEAMHSEAMLPAALVEEANALKYTMLLVVRYHLREEPKATKEIADIIAGTGYLDLASDLGRLAQLYSEFVDELRVDERFYDSGDAGRARRIAADIVRALGESGERPSNDTLIRSYALLERIYEDVRAFGLAMYRKDGGDDMFPSLFRVRANPSARREPGTEPETPTAQ
jgi:hypothetical protein